MVFQFLELMLSVGVADSKEEASHSSDEKP